MGLQSAITQAFSNHYILKVVFFLKRPSFPSPLQFFILKICDSAGMPGTTTNQCCKDYRVSNIAINSNSTEKGDGYEVVNVV